jgi:hypothetical protein
MTDYYTEYIVYQTYSNGIRLSIDCNTVSNKIGKRIQEKKRTIY